MTKRQRAIAEEETPYAHLLRPREDSEEVKRALARIEELKFWVEKRRECQ